MEGLGGDPANNSLDLQLIYRILLVTIYHILHVVHIHEHIYIYSCICIYIYVSYRLMVQDLQVDGFQCRALGNSGSIVGRRWRRAPTCPPSGQTSARASYILKGLKRESQNMKPREYARNASGT